MEGQSSSNDTSCGTMPSSFSSLSSTTFVQLEATAASTLSSVEAQQLSSNSPTSFREMLENDYDTTSDIDLNVPYAPPISSSNSPTLIYDRSFSTIPHCTNCGQKRKAPGGSFEDNEGSDGNTGHCQCQVTPADDGSSQSTNPIGPSINQGPSILVGDTSGDGNSNLLSRPAHSYRNVPRKRPHTIRRSLPASYDTFPSIFTYWNGTTSVNREGQVIHNMQAPGSTLISSQLGNLNGSPPNSSSQVPLMTGAQHRGTAGSQYISLLGHIIPRPIRPVLNSNIGSSVAVQRNGGPGGMNFGSVSENTGGVISNPARADRNILIQLFSSNILVRESIAQALGASNAPTLVANAPIAASYLPAQLIQAFPDHAREAVIRHAWVANLHGRDDRHHGLTLNLDEMSDQEIAVLINEIRVNTRQSEEDILIGLNRQRYRFNTTNDEEEQEICCICLDELGNGQDPVKLDCGHGYHFECIKRWLSEKNCCAVCRKFAIGN